MVLSSATVACISWLDRYRLSDFNSALLNLGTNRCGVISLGSRVDLGSFVKTSIFLLFFLNLSLVCQGPSDQIKALTGTVPMPHYRLFRTSISGLTLLPCIVVLELEVCSKSIHLVHSYRPEYLQDHSSRISVLEVNPSDV